MPYQIWNKADTLYTSLGKAVTAQEFLVLHPLFQLPHAKCVVETGPASLASYGEFEMFKQKYRHLGIPITDDMTDDEVIAAVNEWEANPPVVEQPVTAEERIAAALELGNLINM